MPRSDDHERMRRHSLVGMVFRSRPLLLLAAMVVHIVVSGIVEADWFRLLLLLGVIAGCLAVASYDRRSLVVGLALAAPAVVLMLAASLRGDLLLDLVAYPFLLLLYMHIIRLMLKRIFTARVVTLDVIGLALCTYVLLGVLWLLFYIPVLAADPGAFVMGNLPEGAHPHSQMLYFSYVTLTTLGYGDVTPVSPLAQGLAVTEALTGVLFLAVLISRLVGAYRREDTG